MDAIVCDYCGQLVNGVPIDDAFASRIDAVVTRKVDPSDDAETEFPYTIKIGIRPAKGLHLCPDCANNLLVESLKTFRNRKPARVYKPPKGRKV